jgi:hypothetical protein
MRSGLRETPELSWIEHQTTNLGVGGGISSGARPHSRARSDVLSLPALSPLRYCGLCRRHLLPDCFTALTPSIFLQLRCTQRYARIGPFQQLTRVGECRGDRYKRHRNGLASRANDVAVRRAARLAPPELLDQGNAVRPGADPHHAQPRLYELFPSNRSSVSGSCWRR